MDEAQARASLLSRRDRIIHCGYIFAVLTIPTITAWLVFVLMAEAHRRFVKTCCERGVLTKATLQFEGIDTSHEPLAKMFGILAKALFWAERWVPTASALVRFEVNGKTYTKNMLIFSDESVVRNEDGSATVIYDPEHPKLTSYVIVKREDKIVHRLKSRW